MSPKDKLLKFIDRNQLVTTKEAIALGMNKMALSRLVEKSELYSTERGIYTSSLDWLTDPLKKYLPACSLYPASVISGISALSYYELTDEEERKTWISIPQNQVVKNPRYQVNRLQGLCYSLGIVTHKFGQRVVRIYDIEKSVIDAFKYQQEEVAYKALKNYLKSNHKNLKKLSDYAEKLKRPVSDKIRFYLADE